MASTYDEGEQLLFITHHYLDKYQENAVPALCPPSPEQGETGELSVLGLIRKGEV